MVSACVALYETIQRFIHPGQLTHLWALAAVGLVGFLGNEIAAYIHPLPGRQTAHQPRPDADGNHARVDGFVSLGVVVSAAVVALGYPRADPIVALAITLVILKITWDSWRTVTATEPGEGVDVDRPRPEPQPPTRPVLSADDEHGMVPGSKRGQQTFWTDVCSRADAAPGPENACGQRDRGPVVADLALR